MKNTLPAVVLSASASVLLLGGCQSDSSDPGMAPPMEQNEAGSPRDPQPASQRGMDEPARIPMG